jgi:glycosyltransferase involved in cell wall biosynthesis
MPDGGGATVPVTFVSSHATLGGSEAYLAWLLERLGPEWVRGVVCLADGPFVSRLHAMGMPVALLPTGRRAGLLIGALRLRRVLRRQRPAAVHANGVKAALVCALAGLDAPVIWVKHDFSWDGPLARLVGRRCHRVVGVSRAVTQPLAGGRAQVTIVPNALPVLDVDSRRARESVRALAGGGPVIVLVGRLEPAKGQHELLEAVPRLRAAYPELRVLLIGEPSPHHASYEQRLRNRIVELGLDDRVRLTGRRDDAIELIAGADAVAIVSQTDARGYGREGFGLVAFEAMSVGTPVVAYANGAIPEVVGRCGLLVSEGDSAAFIDALLRVFGDVELRDRLVECGRRRAREEFDVDRMVDAMRSVYRDAATISSSARARRRRRSRRGPPG